MHLCPKPSRLSSHLPTSSFGLGTNVLKVGPFASCQQHTAWGLSALSKSPWISIGSMSCLRQVGNVPRSASTTFGSPVNFSNRGFVPDIVVRLCCTMIIYCWSRWSSIRTVFGVVSWRLVVVVVTFRASIKFFPSIKGLSSAM